MPEDHSTPEVRKAHWIALVCLTCGEVFWGHSKAKSCKRCKKPPVPPKRTKGVTYRKVDRTCVACGKVFTGTRQAKYCSKHCRYKAPPGTLNADPRPAATRTCVTCKKVMPDRGVEFCSQLCRANHRYRTQKMISRRGSCLFCGKPFVAESHAGNRKYCSPTCRNRASSREGERRMKVKRRLANPSRALSCLWCGKKFVEQRYAFQRKHCSKSCRVRMGSVTRRARDLDAFVEDVPLYYLIVRDQGRCRICGEPVDLEKKGPHPESPSIDHIIPVSKGGKHHRGNCQLAHFGCNSAKSDKLD